jgi:DHA1 family multidrug resistance protein-like MFS transporter
MRQTAARTEASWVSLLTIFTFGSLVETIFYGQLSAFTPLYLPKLGIAPASVAQWTGIIAAVTGLLGLPFLPFWGALADRFSRKPVIIRSFAVEIIAALIALLAGNIWVFMVGRTLTCLALGNSGLMMTTLSERAPANRQGVAFSVMNSAAPVGVFLGPLLGGPVVDHWGFPALLAIDVALISAVVLALTFGYHDRFKPASQDSLMKMAGQSITTVIRSPRLRALFPALFMLFAGWMMALTYASLAVSKIYHGTDLGTVVGVVLGAGGFLALFLGPAIGALADRIGYWRVLLVGSSVTILLWPLPALTHSLLPFGIAWALINGVSSGVFSLSFAVLARSASDQERGRVMSFAYLPVNIGTFLGPFLGSLITGNSVFVIFPAAAVLTGIGVVLLVLAHGQKGSNV